MLETLEPGGIEGEQETISAPPFRGIRRHGTIKFVPSLIKPRNGGIRGRFDAGGRAKSASTIATTYRHERERVQGRQGGKSNSRTFLAVWVRAF